MLREGEAVPRADFARPDPLASLELAEEPRAALERVEPELADLARVPVDFPPLLSAADDERDPAPLDRDDAARVPLEREFEEREPAAAERPRAPVPRDVPEDDEEAEELEPAPLEPSSGAHLPDITRCAASATASAISDPSLVALDITLLAA